MEGENSSSQSKTDGDKIVMKYSHRVKTGEWFEAQLANEARMQEFLARREKKELMVQRARRAFMRLITEVPTVHHEGPLRYGDQIMLLAKQITLPNEFADCSAVALTGVVRFSEIATFKHFTEGSVLGGSTLLEPITSNTFKIAGHKCNEDGKILAYGDRFALTPAQCDAPVTLYLEGENPNFSSLLGKSDHPLLKFTANVSRNSAWKVLPLDPRCAIVDDGKPVMPHTNIVINHCASNMNLAAEHNFWNDSVFGKECEVSTFTYMDRTKRYMPQNIWTFVIPSNDAGQPEGGVQT